MGEVYTRPSKIFLDLDEVLVDFVGPAYKLICGNEKEPTVKEYVRFLYRFNKDKDYRRWGFNKIGEQGPDWWSSLPKLPWADKLLETCRSICDRVCILTSPGPLPEAAAGKWSWADKNGLRKNTILASDKSFVAAPGALLIDDRDKYIVPWIEAGGRALKLRRAWSKSGHHPKDIIEVLSLYGSQAGGI